MHESLTVQRLYKNRHYRHLETKTFQDVELK
jgi:hypothetical protein